ncbi:MAG: hypothetical protein U0176_05475 [Bacteroidia bacterium]
MTRFAFSFSMMCLVLLSGCAGQPTAESEAKNPPPANDPTQGEFADARLSGQWCYDYQDSALHLTAVLDVDGKHHVQGNFYADIHDTVQRYWSYYTGEFEGDAKGPDLSVTSRTELEGVVTERKEVWNWPLDGQTLRGHEGRLMRWVDCEVGAE